MVGQCNSSSSISSSSGHALVSATDILKYKLHLPSPRYARRHIYISNICGVLSRHAKKQRKPTKEICINKERERKE